MTILRPHVHKSHGEGALQKRLSILSMVAMGFALINTWIALAGTIQFVLPSGGSVVFVYGFIFCVLCNLALVASLGELVAIWPTAGGQYHFMYALCTDNWKRIMSFFVGWTNIAGWLTGLTAQGFFAAQFISAAAIVASSGAYSGDPWQRYLIFMAILTFGTVGNIYGNKILGTWNNLAMYWSVLAAGILSIVLLSTSDKRDAKAVFTGFTNETGWPDGLAWILGLLPSALSFVGFDVIIHLTEEMPCPARDAPRALIFTIITGGITGFLFILAVLFCLTDVDAALASPTGLPITEMLLQSTGSRAAATILTLMCSVLFINGFTGSITSASRLLYAMARDRGIVFADFFAHIEPGLNVPVRTILLCAAFNALFGLLYLGPATAFNAYTSACTILNNISYVAPVMALLVRGRGILVGYQSSQTPAKLAKFGLPINLVAVIFVVVTSVFFCFPPALPVSGGNMNYVSPVIGVFYILISIYWFVYGDRFQGPNFDAIIGQPLGVEGCNTEVFKSELKE